VETYNLRHKELKQMETEFQESRALAQEASAKRKDELVSYRRLLAMAKDIQLPKTAKDAFKFRTTIDLGVYSNPIDAGKYRMTRFLRSWVKPSPASP
jgi:hypothetical protein